MREALTYLAHAYDANAALLTRGEKRGVDTSLIALYRRKCLTVSDAAFEVARFKMTFPLIYFREHLCALWNIRFFFNILLRYLVGLRFSQYSKSSDSGHPEFELLGDSKLMTISDRGSLCTHNLPAADPERKRNAALRQRRREQGGGGRGHHGRSGHPLPASDEPGDAGMAGGPRHHGEHPQSVVLLSGTGHGRY